MFESSKNEESEISEIETDEYEEDLEKSDKEIYNVLMNLSKNKKIKDLNGLYNNLRTRINGSRFLSIPKEKLKEKKIKFRHWVFYYFGNYLKKYEQEYIKNDENSKPNGSGIYLDTPFGNCCIIPAHSKTYTKDNKATINNKFETKVCFSDKEDEYVKFDEAFEKIKDDKTKSSVLEIMKDFFTFECKQSELNKTFKKNTHNETRPFLSCTNQKFIELKSKVNKLSLKYKEKNLLASICGVLMVSEPLRLLDRGKASAAVINSLTNL